MNTITRITAAVLLVCSPLVLAADGEQIAETLQVSANEKIFIDVMRGQVQIRPGSGTAFSVTGTLDERAEGYNLQSENGFTRFEVQMPRSLNFRGGRDEEGSQLEIEVPRGSEVEFKTVNSRLDIADIEGGTRITSVNGSIDARNLLRFADISTVNGDITSVGNQGRLELKTVNGSIDDQDSAGRLVLGAVNGSISTRSTAEEVELSIVNGEIEADLQQVRNLDLDSVNGEVRVRLSDVSAPRVEGSTVSGSIRLIVPADIDARFSLRSNAGGGIRNELTDDEPTRASYGPARRLEFSSGDGNGVIELSSVSGRLLLSTD